MEEKLKELFPDSPLVRPTVVVFGDSLTQNKGWALSLAEFYTGKLDVINRGFSGYNTRVAPAMLRRILPEGGTPPALFIMCWGANDSCLNIRGQHVPLEEYRASLKEMIAYIRRVTGGVTKIILLAPPPVDEEVWEKECFKKGRDCLDRKNEVTGQYAAAAMEVAKEMEVDGAVDLWQKMQEAKGKGGWKEYLIDGLHLSASGNQFVYNQLKKVLQQWPDLSFDRPFDFPHWSAIFPN